MRFTLLSKVHIRKTLHFLFLKLSTIPCLHTHTNCPQIENLQYKFIFGSKKYILKRVPTEYKKSLRISISNNNREMASTNNEPVTYF